MVTVLLCEGSSPGTTNCLQVMAEIHETRSMRGVFGLRFSRRRFPSGNRRQESPDDAEAVPGAPRSAVRARSGAGVATAISRNRPARVLRMLDDQARAGPGLEGAGGAAIRSKHRHRLPIWRPRPPVRADWN